MTTQKAAMERALEALELCIPMGSDVAANLELSKYALKAALAETAEPVACKHGWFRTGAMAPGEMRCIHCGQWGKAPPAPAVECGCEELLAALKFYLAAWDGGDISWLKNCYAVEDKARAAIAAHEQKGQKP